MTNQNYVRREGQRSEKDFTLSKHIFVSLQRHEWNIIAGYGEGNRMQFTCVNSDVRLAREAFLNELEKNINLDTD